MAIDIDLLLKAYASGIFPMADARDDPEHSGWNQKHARFCHLMVFTCRDHYAKRFGLTVFTSQPTQRSQM